MALDRFETLRVFVAVARSVSFARAAERLGLSRAMVSKHIQALETRLGTRLINRTTRQVNLTEAGRSFQLRAERLLADLEEAEGQAARESEQPRGTLRISAPVTFGVAHVAPALAAFLRAHQGLRADLSLNDRVVDVVEEGFDLAIRIGRLPDSMLIARRLAVARMVVIAAPSYLAARGRPSHPDDLVDHDCLTYAYAASRDEWRFVGPQGHRAVSVQGSLRANSGEALREAACAGLGITLLPTFICGEDIRAGRVACVLDGWMPEELYVHAVHPSGRHVAAKVRRFVDFLLARFAPEPPWDAWMRDLTPRTRSAAMRVSSE
jgi:DNA-binding transcriptional LysR family regulator